MKCNYCGSSDNLVKEYLHKGYQVKDKVITYSSKRRICNNCGSLIYDKELDNNASLEAFRIYNEKYGIPKEDIIKLRKNYKLTQEEFSKIIGCAKKTLISYEQGKSIPNDIYMITMKTLLDNPEIITLLIDSNKERYDYEEYDKYHEKLGKYYDSEDSELSDLNGYTNINYEKIKNLIILLGKKGILKTKLLKEMFYIDFLYYKQTTVSITGLKYIKYQYGPVPKNFEKILESLISQNVIEYKIKFKSEYEYHEIKSKNKDKKIKNIFLDDELQIINKVVNFFENYNSGEIVEYSHNEKAFLDTKLNDYISYDYAFDIDL